MLAEILELFPTVKNKLGLRRARVFAITNIPGVMYNSERLFNGMSRKNVKELRDWAMTMRPHANKIIVVEE